MLDSLFHSLQSSPLASAIRESIAAFPWIEALHVLAITTVVGTIAIVDLRLLGYASHRRGAKQLIRDLLPFTWGAFAVAVASGSLLFISKAVTYASVPQFQLKLLMIAAAGMNMMVFHATAYRTIGEWDDTRPPPMGVRIAGATSLALWILVVFLGRWVGFSLPDEFPTG